MKVKTIAAVALVVPLLTVTGVSTAWAGEVHGPPSGTGLPGGPKANGDGFAADTSLEDRTPVADGVAQSECSFSGLNMYHEGKPADQWPPVQSCGAGVSDYTSSVGGPVPEEFRGIPGDACNGHDPVSFPE